MATNIPVGFAQAAFIFTSDIGTPDFVTTIGVDLSDVGGNFLGAADHLFAAYGSTWMNTTSDHLVLDRVQLNIGLEEGGTGSVTSGKNPITGGDDGDIPPVNLCCIAQKVTNMLGRRGRGRMFLPGVLNETQVTEGGLLGDGVAADLADLGTNFLSAIRAPDVPGEVTPTITPMEPVLFHDGLLAPTPIISIAISPKVGVIRKRVR